MTYTENYALNQWAKTDRIQMSDFNADNAKLDAALKANADALAACGDCVIEAGSYTGAGTYGASHPNSITFQNTPQIVFLNIQEPKNYNSAPEYYILFRGMSGFVSYSSSDTAYLTWEGNTVSWYTSDTNNGAKAQLNTANKTYHYIAICTR